MGRRWSTWFILGLSGLVFASGCGASQPVEAKSVEYIPFEVVVRRDGRPWPFDPDTARVVVASKQLTQIAGHPVTLSVDIAVAPSTLSDFEDFVANNLTYLARDLDNMKKHAPDDFAFAVENLERVELRYDPSGTRKAPIFDINQKAFVIEAAAKDAHLGPGTFSYVSSRAYEAHLAARYQSRPVETLSPTEYRAYVRWLRTEFSDLRQANTYEELVASPFPARLEKGLWLYDHLTNDPETRRRLASWLWSQQDYFANHYVGRAELVRRLAPNAPFHHAARAYGVWARRALPELDAKNRYDVLKTFFASSRLFNAPGKRRFADYTWPGLDLADLGFSQLERWRKAGYPGPEQRMDSDLSYVVCPTIHEFHRSHSAGHCDQVFYQWLFDTTATRKRLVDYLIEQNDERISRVVLDNAASLPRQTFLFFLRALEEHPPIWNIGWHILAERLVDGALDQAVLLETRRLWVQKPELRPLLLYLLVHMDRYQHGNVDWLDFGRAFGKPISEAEFRGFVAEDHLAVSLSPVLWSALSKGWSRAALLMPHLDAWIEAPKVRAFSSQDPYEALSLLLQQMCAEKSTQDLGLMQGYLRARVEAHPGEPYKSLIEIARREECRPAPPPPRPQRDAVLAPFDPRIPLIVMPEEEP